MEGENDNNQIESRLKIIENKFNEIDIKKQIYEESHKKYLNYITIIFAIAAFFFTAAAVVMGFFSYKTSSDLNDAISKTQSATNELSKEIYTQLSVMQKEVVNLNNEMRDKFYAGTNKMDDKLANLNSQVNNMTRDATEKIRADFIELKGESQKKPKIDILYEGNIVTNTSIKIKSTKSSQSNFTYFLKDLGIKNNGDGIAYVTSIKFITPKKIIRVQGGGWFDYDTSVLPMVIGWDNGGNIVSALSPQDFLRLDGMVFSFDGDYMECTLTIYYDLAPVNLKIIVEK